MSASTLEITLPYADLTEFVARFRMVTYEGIELPSPFARKVGDSVRFVVRLLDRTLVLEGTGIVADVTDNGRGGNPDGRYDLAIAFTDKTATTDVMIERLVMAQEFDNTEPTGLRKAPPEIVAREAAHKARPSAPTPAARSAPPPAATRIPVTSPPARVVIPPPVVREHIPDGDLLDEIDEEDMLTPPPRVLPTAPELAAPRTPRPSGPPPLPSRGAAPTPAPRPSSPVRPSSPPERPSAAPAGAPAPRPLSSLGGMRPSAPPSARSSMTPVPPAPSPRAPAPATAPRTAPPRRRTAPGTGDALMPADLRVETQVDHLPPSDTKTDVKLPPARATLGQAKMPLPTRAAPAPRTLTGATIPAPPAAPPRRKTGQRKAVDLPPPADPPVRAPTRRKTLQGAAVAERAATDSPAPPRRKTGTGRVVDAPAPPRRKTGQRRAIDPNDVTQRTPTAGILDEDTDPSPVPPRGRK